MDTPTRVGDAAKARPAADVDEERLAQRRYADAILSGREEERARLAAELHDGPAQAISNMILQTEIVGRALAVSNRSAEVELIALRQLLQRELDRLRAYINELRPPLMEPQGLEDALRDSAAELTANTGVEVNVRLGAPGSTLDEAERAVALRVAQEALRNVAKHAFAQQVWLTTEYAHGSGLDARPWVLEIRDDGRGFVLTEATMHSNRHFGLRFMRERAQLVGAELTISSKPSAGTAVRLTIDKEG